MADTPSTITELSSAFAPLFWYINGQKIYQCTMAQLVAYIGANIETGKAEYTKQYSSPETGATVEVNTGGLNYWVIITPLATLAELTLELPAISNLSDEQEVLFTCSQTITTLTVDNNDADNIVGAPTTMGATSPFKMKYNSFNKTWWKV